MQVWAENLGINYFFKFPICHDEFVQDRSITVEREKMAEQRGKKLPEVLELSVDDGKWAHKDELNFERGREEMNSDKQSFVSLGQRI